MNYFSIAGNVQMVRGYSRSLLIDLHRNRLFFVPNSFYELFKNRVNFSIEEFRNSRKDTIREYFNFLKMEDLIISFEENDAERFPEINYEWDTHAVITNSIIELSVSSYWRNTVNVNLALEELSRKLFCSNIEIRFVEKTSVIDVCLILNSLHISDFKNIEFVFFGVINDDTSDYLLALEQYQNINSVQFFGVSTDKTEIINGRLITYSTLTGISNLHCGFITHANFRVNKDLFSESLHHNSCLNRKLSIDVDGNIKNCPSMEQSFGNIANTELEDAIYHPEFRRYWNIKKADINVCMDCEFRHVCTDCRAYLEEPDNIHSKPLKCGYNPYTSKWENWSANPLKNEAIVHYGIKDII